MQGFPLDNVFGLPVVMVGNHDASGLPRIYSEAFFLQDITIGDSAAIALISPNTIDLKMTLKAVERIQERSGRPCIVCSPSLSFYQREILASKNIAFVLSPKYYFIPFLGTHVTPTKDDSPPKPLSPQAQQLFLSIFYGIWPNCSASDIAKKMGRSNASVTKYFKEIERISPSLIENNGRYRRTIDLKALRNTGFSSTEVLECFEPYLTSPVIEHMWVKGLSDAKTYAQHGAKYAGYSAFAAKTDLAYPEIPTYMFTQESFNWFVAKEPQMITQESFNWFVAKEPQMITQVYDRVGADAHIEIWKYESDFPDPRLVKTNDIEPVDELSLYFSLKNNSDAGEPRIEHALEQIRNDACQY